MESIIGNDGRKRRNCKCNPSHRRKTTNNPMKTKEWKKELYKHFADNDQVSAFEIFVDVLLSARTEEVIEMVEKLEKEYKWDKDYEDYGNNYENICHDDGYKAALMDIRAELRSPTEEIPQMKGTLEALEIDNRSTEV